MTVTSAMRRFGPRSSDIRNLFAPTDCGDCHRLDLISTSNSVPEPIEIANIPTSSPPEVDRIWGTWGSYSNIPKAIFYP